LISNYKNKCILFKLLDLYPDSKKQLPKINNIDTGRQTLDTLFFSKSFHLVNNAVQWLMWTFWSWNSQWKFASWFVANESTCSLWCKAIFIKKYSYFAHQKESYVVLF